MSLDRSKIAFDRSSETMANLLDLIDIRLLVDRLNFIFQSIEQRLSINRARQIVRYKFLIFSTNRGTYLIN